MKSYTILLRGINVGGKNKVSMASLRECLEGLGFTNVATYIASGNVSLTSDKSAHTITSMVEEALPRAFALDSQHIKVLVLSLRQLQTVIDHKPKGFGDHTEKYHSDVVVLIGIDANKAMTIFDPRQGVDRVWPGEGVVYSERLSAERTKSRLSKIIGTELYQSMTIRTWNTTTKLLDILTRLDTAKK